MLCMLCEREILALLDSFWVILYVLLHNMLQGREDIALLLLDKIDDALTVNMANAELKT